MSAQRKYGTAYQEALLALSEQAARLFRENVGDKYEVDACLIQGDTLICASVVFLHSGDEAWVPLEIGTAGWDEARRQRIVEDAAHVVAERLKLEQSATDYIAVKIQEVLDGYR